MRVTSQTLSAMILVLGLSLSPLAKAAPIAGDMAPAVSVTTLDGRHIRLSALRGKVVLINFWATWCAPCMAELPALNAYYQQHRKEGFEVITINVDDENRLNRVREMARSLNLPVALESEADPQGFGYIRNLPASFVIGRDGRVMQDNRHPDNSLNAARLRAWVGPLL